MTISRNFTTKRSHESVHTANRASNCDMFLTLIHFTYGYSITHQTKRNEMVHQYWRNIRQKTCSINVHSQTNQKSDMHYDISSLHGAEVVVHLRILAKLAKVFTFIFVEEKVKMSIQFSLELAGIAGARKSVR